MTVQNTNRKDVYLTNGTTIYWPYTFEIFTTDGSDLALYETNLTTGETKLIDANFTRDIINSRIKYPRTGSPRPEGYKITVARITERTQGIDLETQSFDPKNMERGLDKLTAMVQEIDETVSRAAVADISQQGASFTFPSPVGGKVVGWNAEGTGLINLENTTLGIEAQMLEATEAAGEAAEAAQTAADKVDNLVSTAFEEDETTVKKATHAGSADRGLSSIAGFFYFAHEAPYAGTYLDGTFYSTWSSVGPTGSGADKIWTELDSLPSNIKGIKITIAVEVVSNTLAYVSAGIRVRKNGSTVIPGYCCWAASSVKVDGVYTSDRNTVDVLIDSNKKFQISGYQSGSTVSACKIYLEGYYI